jgi:UDP-glucose 4-epimerase
MVDIPKNILVTGGNGFIGSHLVNELVKNGRKVCVFDRRPKIKWENPNVKVVLGDVQDRRIVSEAGSESELIFHLAAHTRVPESVKDPINDMKTNILGTLNILELARERGIPVVYASSGAVYGNPRYVPMDEEHALEPLSPYGISKLTGEKYCRSYSELYGIKTAVVRFSNVFGPANRKAVVYGFISGILQNKAITVYGSGEQKRDFIYVKDVVQGLLLAAGKTGTYNISTGNGTTINRLADMLQETLGSFSINKEPERKGEIEISTLSNKKAAKELGFSIEYPMETSLAETVEWVKSDLNGKG